MPAALFVRVLVWLWFGGAVAAGHWLALQRLPPLAVPATTLALSGVLLVAAFRLPGLRAWLDTLDPRTFVLLHLSRLVGAYFLILYQRGELPRAFAVPGGMGDIVVAVMTLPVVLAPLDEVGRQRAIRIWNIVGFIHILLMILTVIRLSLTSPEQLRALTQLPSSLYPTFLLPLLIATHVILLHRTAGSRRAA
jgi:hypothetical protein